MAYLQDALAWSRFRQERTVEEAVCMRRTTPIYASQWEGVTSVSRRPVSKAGMRFEIAYMKGYMEVERSQVDSLQTCVQML